MSSYTLEIRPLAGAADTEVLGFDLGEPLCPAEFDALAAARISRSVVAVYEFWPPEDALLARSTGIGCVRRTHRGVIGDNRDKGS